MMPPRLHLLPFTEVESPNARAKIPAVQCCSLATCTFFHGLSVSNQRLHLLFFKISLFFIWVRAFLLPLYTSSLFFENYGGN